MVLSKTRVCGHSSCSLGLKVSPLEIMLSQERSIILNTDERYDLKPTRRSVCLAKLNNQIFLKIWINCRFSAQQCPCLFDVTTWSSQDSTLWPPVIVPLSVVTWHSRVLSLTLHPQVVLRVTDCLWALTDKLSACSSPASLPCGERGFADSY